MAAPEREVYVLVGDGSYLMLNSELVTAVQEGIKIIVVLVVNHGFQSIGASRSRSVSNVSAPSIADATRRVSCRASACLRTSRPTPPVSARPYSMQTRSKNYVGRWSKRVRTVRITVIQIETDPSVSGPDSMSWWDVPVAEVTQRASTHDALVRYDAERKVQRDFLRPTTLPISR